MGNKKISSAIRKKFSKFNTREATSYVKPSGKLLIDNIGRGIHIGDLNGFNANHDMDKSARMAINRNFKDNYTPPLKAVRGHNVINNLFTFGETKLDRKDIEITGG